MFFLSKIYNRLQHYKKQRYINNLVKNGLVLGENVQIVADFFFDPSHCFLISIGESSTICPNVRLIAHDASPKKALGYTKIGKIIIGKNCFLGDSTIVLPDVTIGDNSIIGAGSIVTRSIPENSVAVGHPAKVIGNTLDYLEKIQQAKCKTGVFSAEYLIDNITDDRKIEVQKSVQDGIRFIF